MKGIIITDIPEHCGQCIAYDDEFDKCNASEHEEYIKEDEKPNWCPIKPIPEKMKFYGKYPQRDGFLPSVKIGWNNCIDEILKGENQ